MTVARLPHWETPAQLLNLLGMDSLNSPGQLLAGRRELCGKEKGGTHQRLQPLQLAASDLPVGIPRNDSQEF